MEGFPKSRDFSGTQCLKKAPILLFSCCSQFQRKRTIYQIFTVFRSNIFVRTNDLIWDLSVCPIICPIICVVLVTFIYCFSSFAPLYISCIIHFFEELWKFVIKFLDSNSAFLRNRHSLKFHVLPLCWTLWFYKMIIKKKLIWEKRVGNIHYFNKNKNWPCP